MTLNELENTIQQLSPAEKAQVLQWLARDLSHAYAGIEHSAGIVGGEARIVRTRIPVWVLVQMCQLGATEANILQSYPTLRAEDLINAWAYARTHTDEIEAAIRENEMA